LGKTLEKYKAKQARKTLWINLQML
jgi:hypothetical protein